MSCNKILICGDSIMKGVMFDAEANKYRLCRSHDFDTLAAAGIEIQNRSKMGATIDRGLALLDKLAIQEQESALLLEYGSNDSDHNWAAVSADPDGSFHANIPIESFTEKYSAVIRAAREKNFKVFLCSLLPIDAGKYMQWISRGLNYDNIYHWLGNDVNMLSRWQESYSHAVTSLAIHEGCDIIDIRTPFLLRHDFNDLFCADGIHPTQKGHDLLEATLRDYLLA